MKLSILLLSLLALTSCGRGPMYPKKWGDMLKLCESNGGVRVVYVATIGKDTVTCNNKAVFEVYFTSKDVLEVY